MGEAKRRKKKDKQCGINKTFKVEIYEQISETSLPNDFVQRVVDIVQKHNYKFGVLAGRVWVGEKSIETVYVPYTEMHEGKSKLYSHVMYPAYGEEGQSNTFTQNQVDEISRVVSEHVMKSLDVVLMLES